MSYAQMIMAHNVVVDINKREYETIVPKIRMSANIKMYRNPEGHFIVLSPSNLIMIKFIGEETEGIDFPKSLETLRAEGQVAGKPAPLKEIVPEQKEEPLAPKRELSDEEKAIIAAEPKLDKVQADPEAPKKDPLEEMIEKSNCKHETEKLELYIQHTAKGIRYFPVCSFCGKRERYVSESKIVKGEYAGTPNGHWTEADIVSAKAWTD